MNQEKFNQLLDGFSFKVDERFLEDHNDLATVNGTYDVGFSLDS